MVPQCDYNSHAHAPAGSEGMHTNGADCSTLPRTAGATSAAYAAAAHTPTWGAYGGVAQPSTHIRTGGHAQQVHVLALLYTARTRRSCMTMRRR